MVAPGDPRAVAHRKGQAVADAHCAYVRWDDGPNGNGGNGLCLVLIPVLQAA